MLHHDHSSQPTTTAGPRHRRNQTKRDSPGGASTASSASSNSTKITNSSTCTTFLDTTNNDPTVTSNDEFTSSTSTTTTTPVASTNNPSMANTAANHTTTAPSTTTNIHHGNYGGIIIPPSANYNTSTNVDATMTNEDGIHGNSSWRAIEEHVLNIKKNPSSLLEFRIGYVLVLMIVIGTIIYVGQAAAARETIVYAIACPAMYQAFSLGANELNRTNCGENNEHDEHAAVLGPPPAPAHMLHHGNGTGQRTPIGWINLCNAIAWLALACRAFWSEPCDRPLFIQSMCIALFFLVLGVLCHVYFSTREQTEEIYYKFLSSLACALVVPVIHVLALSVKSINSDSGTGSMSPQEAHTSNEESLKESISIFLFSFVILGFAYGILILIDKNRKSGLSPYTAIGDHQMV